MTPASTRYVDVAAWGGRTCAVRTTGEVDCWGMDYGDAWSFRREGTHHVAIGIDDAVAVDVGRSVCITRRGKKRAECFDARGGPVASRTPLAQLVSGGVSECALTEAGSVYCWGKNDRGQVGLKKRVYRGEITAPTQLPELSGIRQIALGGGAQSCAVSHEGEAWCWGSGADPTPKLHPLTDVRHLALGTEHGCAVVAGGSVLCWGKNDRGQLGSTGSSSHLPLQVAGVSSARQVAAGAKHSCALLDDGNAACWGDESRHEPKGVQSIELDDRATEIAAGSFHDCALLESGRLTCWGSRVPRLTESCRR